MGLEALPLPHLEEGMVKNQKILLYVRFFFSLKLSEKNSVRVSDVGISKEAAEITGTIAGSPVYIAPEVFQFQLYNSTADIYSLGIILWEVWYGEQAFARIGKITREILYSLVKDGVRPEPLQGYKQPPWEELMMECWKVNPLKPQLSNALKNFLVWLSDYAETPLSQSMLQNNFQYCK